MEMVIVFFLASEFMIVDFVFFFVIYIFQIF